MFDYLEVQGLVEAMVNYLLVSTKEIEVRTALMGIEYQEIVAKQEQEQKTGEKQGQGQGMMQAPFGYCPKCGEAGTSRSRGGMDICKGGHSYSSKQAVLRRGKSCQR